jgi:hypothetical protein
MRPPKPALIFLYLPFLSHAATTIGPLAPLTIASSPAFSSARACAAACISYSGPFACGVNRGYNDLPVFLGCGCSPNNACFCSEGLKSSASSYISSCVSEKCKGGEDVANIVGLSEGYCKTANVEAGGGSSVGGGSSTAVVTTAGGGASATATPGASRPRVSDETATATATGSATGSPGEKGKEEEGLSKSDIIALGTGVGLGVPSLIIGAIALWVQIRKKRAAAAEAGGNGNGNGTAHGLTPSGSQTHMLQSWTPSPTPPVAHVEAAGPVELGGTQSQGHVYELSTGRK